MLAPVIAGAQEPVGTANPLSDALVPAPALSPGEVVRIQLEALRHNDLHNRGIEVAFRFASPANRANTGPLARFVSMIRNGPYALMLGFRAASYGPVETRGTPGPAARDPGGRGPERHLLVLSLPAVRGALRRLLDDRRGVCRALRGSVRVDPADFPSTKGNPMNESSIEDPSANPATKEGRVPADSLSVEARRLEDDGAIPNNAKLPLLVYRQAVALPEDDPAAVFEALFTANGWPAAWRNGVHPFHHYHSTAHEVLGVFSGRATACFGGEHGVRMSVSAGDVVIIPAGVGHKGIEATPDLGIVGAYPAGNRPRSLPRALGRAARLSGGHRAGGGAAERSRLRRRRASARALVFRSMRRIGGSLLVPMRTRLGGLRRAAVSERTSPPRKRGGDFGSVARPLAAAAVAALLSLGNAVFAQSEPLSWTMPTPHAPNTFLVENAERFAEELEAAGGGRIRIEVQSGGRLYTHEAIARAVREGAGSDG